MRIGLIRRWEKCYCLQFLFIASVMLLFTLAAITIMFGGKYPGFNFGMLIVLFIAVSRSWHVTCPFSAWGKQVPRLRILMSEEAVITEGTEELGEEFHRW